MTLKKNRMGFVKKQAVQQDLLYFKRSIYFLIVFFSPLINSQIIEEESSILLPEMGMSRLHELKETEINTEKSLEDEALLEQSFAQKKLEQQFTIEDDDIEILTKKVSKALQKRLLAEHKKPTIKLHFQAGTGIDSGKLNRVFKPRLKQQLGLLNGISFKDEADVRMHIRVSIQDDRLFVVSTLEGEAQLSPITVVVSMLRSMTLERSLGGSLGRAQTHYVLRRVGFLPAGVLDVFLADVQGDFVDELFVLSIKGLTIYQLLPSTSEWEILKHFELPKIKNHLKLRSHPRWPRLLTGWLAQGPHQKIVGATTAGHSFIYDPQKQKISSSRRGMVPLAQPRGVLENRKGFRISNSDKKFTVLWAVMDRGNPSVRMKRPDVLKGKFAALSKRIRDVQVWKDAESLRWVWIDDEGYFFAQFNNQKSIRPLLEKVGDRFLLADFDEDGQVEALVTSASGPGESDSIQMISLEEGEKHSTYLKQDFVHGSISAMAQGDVDLDGHIDVLLVEEGKSHKALLWHLEYAP